MKILIGVILSFFSLNLFAGDCGAHHYIVSDFDDTIKTYKSKSALSKFSSAIWGTKINAGFNVLLQEMTLAAVNSSQDCQDPLFTVLSASPKIVGGSVNRLLSKNDFPAAEIILKRYPENTYDYKKRMLDEIAVAKDLPLILIGDDTSHDPEVYGELSLSDPSSVLVVYIHNVNNRGGMAGQRIYLTAFDIAVSEYEDGRLDEAAVLRIGSAVIDSADDEIIPSYGYCPTSIYTRNLAGATASIEQIRKDIGARISSICQSRHLKK